MTKNLDWSMMLLCLILGMSIGSDLTFRFLQNDLHRARLAIEAVQTMVIEHNR